MTQLLISVKNMQEAMLVLATGVDIIDLKDPNIGALGALDLTLTQKIVRQVNGRNLVSATVGEAHTSLENLLADIQLRANAGVDIVKIAIADLSKSDFSWPDLYRQDGFFDEIRKLTKAGVKIVAVFFADEQPNFDLLPTFKQAGFYGAMLDTRNKSKNLLQVQPQAAIHLFTQLCLQYQLKSGLAGSLQPQHIEKLVAANPSYIGFRGGVCSNGSRIDSLIQHKVVNVKEMLHERNKTKGKAQEILALALRS